MIYLLTGLGLVLLIEGLVYALAPSLIETLLAAMRDLSLQQRRIMGFIAMLSGVGFLWIAGLLSGQL